jgi:hypothetical protein
MNLKKDEIWVCREAYCGAEIKVIRAANSACHGKFTLRCCCGKEMVAKESVQLTETIPAAPGVQTKR